MPVEFREPHRLSVAGFATLNAVTILGYEFDEIEGWKLMRFDCRDFRNAIFTKFLQQFHPLHTDLQILATVLFI